MPPSYTQKHRTLLRPSIGPFPPRPTAVMARKLERLREARRAAFEPLDTWVIYNTDSAGWIGTYLDSPVAPSEVACYLWVTHKKAPEHPVFRDPDMYQLWMHVEIPPQSGIARCDRSSPTIILATFSGFKDEDDTPRWIHYYNPGERYRFAYERGFLAEVFCGRTQILAQTVNNITSRMLNWACAAAVGTAVEDAVRLHCKEMRAFRRIPCYVEGQRDVTRWVRGETLRSS
ncbi:hypothetical protein DFH06DRAFT_422388 [Mycena polygramma]|nr:hypothetical protein DFH06DRAFT_422388 [Mycena polygramma]